MMPSYDGLRDSGSDVARDLIEERRVRQIRSLDAVEVGPADVPVRVDQRHPFVFDLKLRAHANHGDLDDAIVSAGIDPSRLDVDDGEWRLAERGLSCHRRGRAAPAPPPRTHPHTAPAQPGTAPTHPPPPPPGNAKPNPPQQSST